MPNGLQARTIDPALLSAWPLPLPERAGDKEARGCVLVVGGAQQMPGAVILAGLAALRAGAGKLQVATVAGQAPAVAGAIPEAFVHALPQARDGGFAAAALRPLFAACERADVVALGPGTIENGPLARLVLGLLARLEGRQTVVLDAGALTQMAPHRARLRRSGPALIVTPHAGEMAKLLGRRKADVRAAPLAIALRAARELRAVVALKGADTVVTDGRRTFRNRAGNVGLATSGSGDVLAGAIAGLAARGADPLQATVWGVALHARAGDVLARTTGPIGYLARELLPELPRVMAALSRRRR